ncbi:nuclear transport factor 2 family protein [Amycolatopsis magusensis]|uniref:DUF4440 domain-containing protein n=1 Tax=Amycolatopsis magusensis TaxID=882444 RepID=A0ABS4Q3G3_9PSEU|nr:nuclear transport factor 2 family protein [Amycolatopsis magusensis]MBP2185634.1 hypothetical protein [Amycolatopsis magusensis]
MSAHRSARPALLAVSLFAITGLTACDQSSPVTAPGTATPAAAPSSAAAAKPDQDPSPQSVSEEWLHSVASGDFARACALYDPAGDVFSALGGVEGCAGRFAKDNDYGKAFLDSLATAKVDPGLSKADGDTAVIPMDAVTIDGKKWNADAQGVVRMSGDFMTLTRKDGQWLIRDYTDAVLVTPPGT